MDLNFTLAGKTKVVPPSAVSSGRYQFLSLSEAEPSLGIPETTGTFFLTGNNTGSRGWTKGLPEINLDVIRAKQIYTTYLSAASADISDLYVDRIRAISANIDESYIKSLTADKIDIDRLDLKELYVESLTALSANIDFLDVNYTTGFIVGGDLGITGNTAVTGNLTANDAFFDVLEANHVKAITKSFLINHPTKKDKKLHYGSLESPYHGIRLTGKGTVSKGFGIIELPEYISDFVSKEDVNIQITNYRHNKVLYVDTIDIEKNKFTVKLDGLFNKFSDYQFFWSFTAVRKDVEKLLVEE